MKLNRTDVENIKRALRICKVLQIDIAVISEGKIRALSESKNAAIFSDLEMSFSKDVSLGISRVQEFEKRLSAFSSDVSIDAEINDANKVRKLTMSSKNNKIEFRTTDIALLERKYPKSLNEDPAQALVKLSQDEVQTLSRSIKVLSAESAVLQIKKDGSVHFEGMDSSNDKFEVHLDEKVEFLDSGTSFVFQYSTNSDGTFLRALEYMQKEQNEVSFILLKSGNIGIILDGLYVLIIPKVN